VLKEVIKFDGFYKFSLELEKLWPQVLYTLCTENTVQGVQTNLALGKQLSEIFDFVFHFDECKMLCPFIQNHFSYYRRVLGRMKNTNPADENNIVVDEEIANKISFFYAYPTPMMKVIIDATVEFHDNAKPRLIEGLSLISNLCLKSLEKVTPGEIEGSKAVMLALCAMTGCIILVDHLHEQGVFHKKSPIRIRSCIQKLKTLPSTDFLINSLRFTTLHLHDDTTIPAITKLLS